MAAVAVVDRRTGPRRVRIEPGIYRRWDTCLEIGWRDSAGKQRWAAVPDSAGGRGIQLARRMLAEARADASRGVRVAVDPRLRFADAADAWWEARVVKLRPATQNAYGAGLAHLRRPENFGRSRLTDITPTNVARFVSRQQTAGLKGWTIKGHLTVLSAVFRYAARHLGFPGANPVGLLDAIERPSTDDEKSKRILTRAELEQLLSKVDAAHRLIFEVGAETGGRLAEVLGLAWEDIDLEAETVTFTHQLDRKGKRQPLKTKRSRRCLEVTPQLIVKLRAHKVASGVGVAHELVFTTARGTGHDHRNIGGRVLSRAVELAGLGALEGPDGEVLVPAPTFHSLRHSHASALIAYGWDIEEVSARLGHRDVATTQRVYVHEFDAARRSSERRGRLTAIYGGGSSVEAGVGAADRSDASGEGVRGDATVTPLRLAAGRSQ
jgi:integrase